MNYHIKASSISNKDAVIHIKESNIDFGTTLKTAEILPNPAELFLGSFAACVLKNVERFSTIIYHLTIYSNDKKLNTELLKKNIEKFGTIYNTVKLSCTISGTINTIENV